MIHELDWKKPDKVCSRCGQEDAVSDAPDGRFGRWGPRCLRLPRERPSFDRPPSPTAVVFPNIRVAEPPLPVRRTWRTGKEPRPCRVPGCVNRAVGRDLCPKCRQRAITLGLPFDTDGAELLQRWNERMAARRRS